MRRGLARLDFNEPFEIMKDHDSANEVLGFYDDDYLFFSAETLGPERTQNELTFIWEALGLQSDQLVLDLGCGHGRISKGMAQRGVKVTGIEVMPRFLDQARRDAAKAGLHIDYRKADIRQPIDGGPFDAALLWFFSFGYHSDEDNCGILNNVARSLKPGGRLLFDQYNTSALARAADHYSVLDFGTSLLLQKPVWDLEAGRWGAERIVVRDGQIRRSRFTCRSYSPAEIRQMLIQAGFHELKMFGDGFQPLELDSTRLIVKASKRP